MTKADVSLKKGSLADRATELLRDGILDMTYMPGAHISEAGLMRSLDMGRTPIREALNRLAAEGLVEFENNKGAQVRSLDVHEIDQIFEAYGAAGQIAAAYCRFDDAKLLKDVTYMQEQHRRAIKNRQPLKVSFWNYEVYTRIARSSRNAFILDFCYRTNNHARRLNTLVYSIEATFDEQYPSRQIKLASEMQAAVRGFIERKDSIGLGNEIANQAVTFRKRFGRAIERSRTEASASFSKILADTSRFVAAGTGHLDDGISSRPPARRRVSA